MNNDEANALVSQPKRRSIGTLLLWAVNLPLVVVLAVLLPLDYQREVGNAISQKHANLKEEALTIYQGLSCLAQGGHQDSVQRYIDSICAYMQESKSPGHHIVIRWNGNLFQAEAMHHVSSEITIAMQQASASSDHSATFDDKTLVVGSFRDKDVDVYVSEFTTDSRSSIQREILLHLSSLAALALAAAAIVNLVLWWIVARPVRQLSCTVARIAEGDYDVKANGFRSREMNELSTVIQRMSNTLSANERDRCAQMDRARRIQEHLLPNGVKIPGFAVAHRFLPANSVAGDYYDMIRFADDTWLICVADVSGHGIAGAMGSAMLKTLLMHAADRYREPRDILRFVNDRLPDLLPDEFITMFLARWNSGASRLEYASAGHEPGLLISPNGELRELLATGLPLGVSQSADWETEAIEVKSGQHLVLTTDGVAEATSPQGELFGRKRLTEVASKCSGDTPDQVVGLICDALLRHQQSSRLADDVTILVLESNAVKLRGDGPHGIATGVEVRHADNPSRNAARLYRRGGK